jgi:1,4-alpha-glucan branching enzyme
MVSRSRKARPQRSRKEKPKEHVVHFQLANPSARRVCVAGTFNNWQAQAGVMARGSDGVWARDFKLKPGTYEYRLVVDGKWMPDPQADHSVVNGFGERNSLLTVR